MPDYYCSQKFWWLTVNPERRTLASCCSARPALIDMNWLHDNPDQIFNTPDLVREREAMLRGERVESCEANCWSAEDNNRPSRRTTYFSQQRTHHSVITEPEVLNILIGTDCNLTCVYCCKEFSTAWLREIEKNGPYLKDDRFTINSSDRIIMALGQKQLRASSTYQKILDSVTGFSNLRQVNISGGEPFLYNGLLELVEKLNAPIINITTGLGIDAKRFANILDKISGKVTLHVSGESVGPLYEFVRYGNTYKNFLINLEAIKQRNIPFSFTVTLTNLTLLGYKDFEDQFGQSNNSVQLCNEPDYFAPAVLDPESKEKLLSTQYKYHEQTIKDAVSADFSQQQKNNLRIYLSEFAKRRNLQMDIFPKSFREWIDNGC
jgi:organic radical activating enzyme